jgi:hypothetical protein
MASARADLRWAPKILASAAFFLVGAAVAAGLYFGNLAYVRASEPLLKQVTCGLSTKRLHKGITVELTYKIDANRQAHVGLGAGIYNEEGQDYSTGFGDINSFDLRAGRTVQTRPVLIPANLPPGQYEIDGEIWPPDQVGANGANTYAGPTCGRFNNP